MVTVAGWWRAYKRSSNRASHSNWAGPGHWLPGRPSKSLFILQNRGRMNNTSPFSFLESIVSRFQPPAWVVDEGQQRLVLFLNHVLMQEKQAQDRLLRQKDRVLHIRCGM